MPKLHLVLMPLYGSPMIPHLGLACLSAYLKKKGIDVRVTDFRLLYNNDAFQFNYYFKDISYVVDIPDLSLILHLVKNFKSGRHLLDNLDEATLDYIHKRPLNYFYVKSCIENAYHIIMQHIEMFSQYKYIGFTTVVSNILFTVMLSLILRRKNPDIKIIYGGPQATLSSNFARLVLRLGIADVVVLGEGESVLEKIIYNYEQGKSVSVEGSITYDKRKGVFISKPQNNILDLDKLPCPDFSGFPLEKYADPLFLPTYASRGCVFKCRFCTYNKHFGSIYRQMSPLKAVDIMEHLHKEYRTFRLQFADTALNINNRWLEEFSEELIRRKSNLQWRSFLIPRMTRKLLVKLKQSGLYEVHLGAESLSERVLKRMGKGCTNSKEIIRTIELFCREGILVNLGIIVGFPGESDADFLYTWRQLLKLCEKFPRNFTIKEFPFQLRAGSDCYNSCSAYGFSLKGWEPRIRNMVPEASDIVADSPMSFYRASPTNRTVIDRLALIKNIKLPDQICVSISDKEYARECLKYLKKSSRVSVPFVNYRIVNLELKGARRRLFALHIKDKTLPLSEREMLILQELNGRASLAEIAHRLSLRYKEDKEESYHSILRFIHYLGYSNVQLRIAY